uniref:Glycosyl transferase n=1 Tax=Thermosporothrix sp. COM3 TaxID=2490863 RepID=A0A455ST00_9CHLR|nr:glycosyl transferase [Thermosporothrix sp. COM3]
MKVAHIAPPWLAIPPKNYGGTEVVLYNLIEEQVKQGHDVTLFAPGDAQTSARHVSFFPHALLDEGAPWSAHLKPYYHYFKAIEYISRHDFDIIHTHLSSASDMYQYPLLTHIPVPHVSTLHSPFPFDKAENWVGDADTYYYEWLRDIPFVAISKSAQKQVPFVLNFVGVVHHGLPMEVFHPKTFEPADYAVWLGRIVADKGTHLAIEAARLAGIRLILAGTLDSYLPSSIEYYEKQIRPQIDGQQVVYIGPVNMQQKIELLSKARVLLNPIEWEEPFGMVMLEAMALGCPVISFARGAAPEIVAPGISGFLVRTLDEMVQAIPKVESLDRTLVRAYVRRHFSAQVMAEKYTRVYEKVIAARKPALAITPLSSDVPLSPLKTDEAAPA